MHVLLFANVPIESLTDSMTGGPDYLMQFLQMKAVAERY